MKSKKADTSMLTVVMGFILAILGLVIIVYVFIGMGLGGPVKSQTFGLTCTFSAYARGAFLEIVEPILATITWIIGLSYTVTGTLITGILMSNPVTMIGGFVTGPATVYETINAVQTADAFSIAFLSYIPIMCPEVTLDIGHDITGKEATPERFYNSFGGIILDAYDMFGHGNYDAIMGQDPPNPRTAYILETHLTEEVSFLNAYNNITAIYGEKTEWFTSGGGSRIYLYCQKQNNAGEYEIVSAGYDRAKFDECKIKDSRIYVMYRDYNKYDMYTSGTHICSPNLQQDAKDYSLEMSFSNIGFRDVTDLEESSPWRMNRDSIVLCIYNIYKT